MNQARLSPPPRSRGRRHLSCWILFSASLGAPTNADITVGGDRPVDIHVPAAYDGSVPLPLVLLLHGAPGNGVIQEGLYRLTDDADRLGFLYGYPDGTPGCGDHFWNATDACCSAQCGSPASDDSAYLRRVIEETREKLKVDSGRIYIVGNSNGGFMAYRLACDHADLIAGIASISGAALRDAELCSPAAPVHVLHVHGTLDTTINYEGGSNGAAPFPGALDSVSQWAMHNGCVALAEPVGALDLFVDPGEETEVLRFASGCRPGGSVELWSVVDQDHSLSADALREGDSPRHALRALEWLLERKKGQAAMEVKLNLLPASGTAPLEMTLDASDSTPPGGETIERYLWDFGDGHGAEGPSVLRHTFTTPGRFAVAVTVQASDGQQQTRSGMVSVLCPGSDLSPWEDSEIGTPTFPGAARQGTDSRTVELCAAGGLLGRTTKDAGDFVHQSDAGDLRVSCRLSLAAGSPPGSIGVLARSSLDAGAPLAAALVDISTGAPAGRTRAAFRTAPDTFPRSTNGKALDSAAVWVRLERRGTIWTGLSSQDGLTWIVLGERDVPALAGPVLVGVAGASADNGNAGFRPLEALIDSLELGGLEAPPPQFRRANPNADGTLDLSDAISTLGYLFLGTPAPACLDAADANDSGSVDLSDAVYTLGYLFLGTAAPPAPFPECGADPTGDDLPCDAIPGCP